MHECVCMHTYTPHHKHTEEKGGKETGSVKRYSLLSSALSLLLYFLFLFKSREWEEEEGRILRTHLCTPPEDGCVNLGLYTCDTHIHAHMLLHLAISLPLPFQTFCFHLQRFCIRPGKLRVMFRAWGHWMESLNISCVL